MSRVPASVGPMKYVALPSKRQYSLPFYLAMEEYVARELPAQDYFFMWQVEPTVIFGRNQLVESEVDTQYCRANGIEFYRRKSGGGCVYADKDNIMLSYITPKTNVNSTFNCYMLLVENALQQLGIKAGTSGRNDILVDGKKVSGNAFYHLYNRSIVHGTMLYSTNIEAMARATTPSEAKLKSKGVDSVRQCVTTLNKYISLSIEELKQYLRSSLCDEEILLGEKDIAAIHEIEKEYYSPEFIYGKNPAGEFYKKERIEGVGELSVAMEVKEGVMRKVNISGDFFIVGELGLFLERLSGVAFERSAVMEVLQNTDPSTVIRNLKKEQLINLLFN